MDANGNVDCTTIGAGGRKGGSFVSDSFQQIRELRDQFIGAVYDLRDPNTGQVMGNAIMQRIGLDPENSDDEVRYAEIAQYFDEIGYIWGEASDYCIVTMSELGIKYVEVEDDLRREEGRA
jgi:hypothetical protein